MDISRYKPKGKVESKHLLTLRDIPAAEIYEYILAGIRLKKLHYKNKPHRYLKGQTLAMIFSKSSTRTRVSFEQGIKQLGGSAIFLSAADIQLGRGETVRDTAKTLARFDIDGIMIRTDKQSNVEELAKYGGVPVINGLTDLYHPCQILADLMTVYEIFGRLEGIKLAFFGDGFNIAHSLMIGGAKCGLKVVVCSPEGCRPDAEITAAAKKFGDVTVTGDVDEAISGADAVYSDVWFSMGQKPDEKKVKLLEPYRVTQKLMEKASPDAVFLHCLPAHRGEEVDADVIDSERSVVFEEAENRLHVQKAVMALLMKKR